MSERLAESIAAALVTGAENMDGVGGLVERARIFRHLSAVIRSAIRGGGIEAPAPADATSTIPTLHEADEYADMALQAHELRECLAALYARCDDDDVLYVVHGDAELDARVRQALSLPARPPRPPVCTCDATAARPDPALHALSCPMRGLPNA